MGSYFANVASCGPDEEPLLAQKKRGGHIAAETVGSGGGRVERLDTSPETGATFKHEESAGVGSNSVVQSQEVVGKKFQTARHKWFGPRARSREMPSKHLLPIQTGEHQTTRRQRRTILWHARQAVFHSCSYMTAHRVTPFTGARKNVPP